MSTGVQAPAEAGNGPWILTQVLGNLLWSTASAMQYRAVFPPLSLFKDLYSYLCLPVCEKMHVYVGTHGSQKKIADPHGAGVTGGCGFPEQCARKKLCSFVRAASDSTGPHPLPDELECPVGLDQLQGMKLPRLDHGLHELGVFSEVPAMPQLAGVLCHLVEAHSYGIAESWLLPSVGAMTESTVLPGTSGSLS